ncbi:hypothetical protein JW911_01225 [Candidatus Peregrinibacteria bacterium]|nr:hypothetical protein [Candidatus Peregrinibacteria bacterium]
MKPDAGETLNTFRQIVDMMIENSLLLSIDEKQEFLAETPTLGMESLFELFNLLTGAKNKIDDVLKELAENSPGIMEKLDEFQIETLKIIFKEQRDALITY